MMFMWLSIEGKASWVKSGIYDVVTGAIIMAQ